MLQKTILALFCALPLMTAACSDGDDLDSDTEARWAYLGFDNAVDRSIGLGLDGFNAATNANIPEQIGNGEAQGTLTVGGQVDQGASSNKEMNLTLALVDYSDGTAADTNSDSDFEIIYNSEETLLPLLSISLRNIPNGTFSGTLAGDFFLSGDVDADASFDLTLSGSLQEDPASPGNVIREEGTLSITGTVSAGDGVFDVNVMR